jgi:hypothetical protein
MDIRCFDGAAVLKHPKGVQGWLDERFMRKDRILDAFSKTHEMPKDVCGQAHLNIIKPQFSNLAPMFALALLPTSAVFMGLQWIRGY